MTRTALIVILLLCATCAVCAENTVQPKADAPKTEAASTPAKEVKITISVKEAKPSEVIESIVKQAEMKMVVESTVKAKVSLSLENVSVENALTAFCKAGKFEWRKVYLDKESKLLEQPDRLAATVRLMTNLGFPDIVVAGASTKKMAVHSEGEKAAKQAESKLVKELGLSPVYLITNDAAVAAKKTEEEGDEKKESKAVDEYINGTKKLMDSFLNMSPEEREQAMVESLNLMDQVGPGYMSSVMQALMDSDPALLRQMMGKQTQMLFDMDEDTRRRMMRMNMEAASMLTPEQMEILKQDQRAILEQMQREGGNPTPAP